MEPFQRQTDLAPVIPRDEIIIKLLPYTFFTSLEGEKCGVLLNHMYLLNGDYI